MLLRFDRPTLWVPYALLVGLPPIFFAATPEYYTTSITGHALTLVLSTPRLVPAHHDHDPVAVDAAAVGPGAIMGDRIGLVRPRVGRTQHHRGVARLGSPAQIALSVAWFMQIAYWVWRWPSPPCGPATPGSISPPRTRSTSPRPGRRDHLRPAMTATPLAHTGHLLPHGRTAGLIGAALLLLGAALVLLRARRPDG